MTAVSIRDLRVNAISDPGRTIEIIHSISLNVVQGEVVEHLAVNELAGATHSYSRLLFRSIPQLNPTWLDSLDRGAPLVPAFAS